MENLEQGIISKSKSPRTESRTPGRNSDIRHSERDRNSDIRNSERDRNSDTGKSKKANLGKSTKRVSEEGRRESEDIRRGEGGGKNGGEGGRGVEDDEKRRRSEEVKSPSALRKSVKNNAIDSTGEIVEFHDYTKSYDNQNLRKTTAQKSPKKNSESVSKSPSKRYFKSDGSDESDYSSNEDSVVSGNSTDNSSDSEFPSSSSYESDNSESTN